MRKKEKGVDVNKAEVFQTGLRPLGFFIIILLLLFFIFLTANPLIPVVDFPQMKKQKHLGFLLLSPLSASRQWVRADVVLGTAVL